MAAQHISGKDAGQVMLYALSTCIWCKKTRAFLEELGVAYDYEYVDLLQGEERVKTVNALQELNHSVSFPTLKINNDVIIGFKEDKIREALGV